MVALLKDLTRVLKDHWTFFTKFIVITIAIIVVLNAGFWVASRNARSCTACHVMEPYYEQWKTSSHSNVTCVECHPNRPATIAIATIKYFSGTYNPKLHAVVEDASCLKEGCHSNRLKEPDILFKGSILFDHDKHMGHLQRGKRLTCTSCHSQIVQGKHMSVTEDVCYLCHFKGAGQGQSVTGCPSCHGIPTKIVEHDGFRFSHESYLKLGVDCSQCHLQISEGDGSVPKERCHNCHVERLEGLKDPMFLHQVHVTRNEIACFNCHDHIKHGEISMIQALEVSCEKCHERLHSMQKEMYMGSSGRGVNDLPSRMFAAQVSCDGCHTHVVTATEDGVPVVGERSAKPEAQSCVVCHGEGYDLMLDDWIKGSNAMVNFVEPIVMNAEKALNKVQETIGQSGMGIKDFSEEKTLVTDARYNLDMVKTGRGVHNIEYAVWILKAGLNQVELAMKKMEPAWTMPEKPPVLATQDAYCTEMCHTRIGLKEVVRFEEMHHDFPHALHVESVKLPCTTCHSPEKHKQSVISKDQCMSCHHQPDNLDCAKCHGPTSKLYSGKPLGHGAEPVPDYMAAVEIGCDGCHDLEDKLSPIKSVPEKCASCHDESYAKMLKDWYNDIQKLTGELTVKLENIRPYIEAFGPMDTLTPDRAKMVKAFREAEDNIKAVEAARGTHNYEYAMMLLNNAKEKLNGINVPVR